MTMGLYACLWVCMYEQWCMTYDGKDCQGGGRNGRSYYISPIRNLNEGLTNLIYLLAYESMNLISYQKNNELIRRIHPSTNEPI